MVRGLNEEDLHAYVDGRLDVIEAAQVEAHLAANPADAARVESFRSQRALLRAMYQQAAFEPEPEAMVQMRDRLAVRLAARPAGRWSGMILLLGILLGSAALALALILLLSGMGPARPVESILGLAAVPSTERPENPSTLTII